jgi:hypothetical protein
MKDKEFTINSRKCVYVLGKKGMHLHKTILKSDELKIYEEAAQNLIKFLDKNGFSPIGSEAVLDYTLALCGFFLDHSRDESE